MDNTSLSSLVKDSKTDIAERIRTTAEDLVELVTAQVKLVRLELLADARELGARLTRVAIFIPVALIGYGFLAAAGVWALGKVIGLTFSLLAVGAAHLAVGAWGVVRAVLADFWTREDHGHGWEAALACAELLSARGGGS
jgi:hypothetical protein